MPTLARLYKKTVNIAKEISLSLERAIGSSVFLYMVFLWFILQAAYMAFSTLQGIPPDENYHITFIRLFTENGWGPVLSDQQGYYALGAVTHTPFFLYHYLLSLPAHFFVYSEQALYFFRMINVGLGTASLYFIYRIGSVLRLSPVVKNISLFMMANTMMFVFMSASVNYDNLFIVLSLASILLLLLIIDKITAQRLILLSIALISGMLIKISFLPIAAIAGLVLVITFCQKPKLQIRNLRLTFLHNKIANILLLTLLIAVTTIFSYRYIGNLISYSTYSPNCTRTLTLDQCRQNGIFRRSEVLDARTPPKADRSPYEYGADWIALMAERTYGIFAHKRIMAPDIVLATVFIWLLAASIATIRRFRPHKPLSILMLFTFFYLAALVIENYTTYTHRGIFDLAVQGRYSLAVLPLIYLVGNHYLCQFLKRPVLKGIYFMTTILIFLPAALPFYIRNTTPDWHNVRFQLLNEDLKGVLSQIY